ncbi:MAG: tetratricopeptide repeat protein [Planctomycetota bacterium]|nr:tetratricopeptide repeat protein [Planctomycetota bacterium]
MNLRTTRQPALKILTCLFLALFFALPRGVADKPSSKPYTAEQLVKLIRPGLVTISTQGRDGQYEGVGTGFVIDPSGLIATNLHVIGESRDFRITDSNGDQLTVTAIHASDRLMDLAIVRVAQQELKPLRLGNLSDLPQGAPVVVMGNPHGLENSIVAGINSGTRVIGGRTMMQLAIPIEPGNSGGPVVDMTGKVYGIVTMKSVVTANLGFAIDVAPLKSLLATPNPIAIQKWLQIGLVNPEYWTTLHGAQWKQQGGRIEVRGSGSGFAGRSLCLSKEMLPQIPYEIEVRVKLSDERGAAGIAFHSDGNQKHYGFYPTNNKIRFTRFEGSSVFSWTVLYDQPHALYRPGEFNTLRVRIEKERIQLFLNGSLVLESADRGFTQGQVGLVKFRDTAAVFRNFTIAKEIPSSSLPQEETDRIQALVDKLPTLENLESSDLSPLLEHTASARRTLKDHSKQLQIRLDELKQISDDIHVAGVAVQLHDLLEAHDLRLEKQPKATQPFDLVHAALLIALVDQEEIDVNAYRQQVTRMGKQIAATIKPESSQHTILQQLNTYLFTDNGFHGSRFDYNHPANSYLNRVLDDREGLPITLSLLYITLARQLGLEMYGVGIPGHFIVAHREMDTITYIDPFNDGKTLSLEEVRNLATGNVPSQFQPRFLEPVLPRPFLMRILNNLLALAQDAQDKPRMLKYLELLVALDETHLQNRGMRATVRYETGHRQGALNDLDWFLRTKPPELDLEQIQRMRDFFSRPTR